MSINVDNYYLLVFNVNKSWKSVRKTYQVKYIRYIRYKIRSFTMVDICIDLFTIGKPIVGLNY